MAQISADGRRFSDEGRRTHPHGTPGRGPLSAVLCEGPANGAPGRPWFLWRAVPSVEKVRQLDLNNLRNLFNLRNLWFLFSLAAAPRRCQERPGAFFGQDASAAPLTQDTPRCRRPVRGHSGPADWMPIAESRWSPSRGAFIQGPCTQSTGSLACRPLRPPRSSASSAVKTDPGKGIVPGILLAFGESIRDPCRLASD